MIILNFKNYIFIFFFKVTNIKKVSWIHPKMMKKNIKIKTEDERIIISMSELSYIEEGDPIKKE